MNLTLIDSPFANIANITRALAAAGANVTLSSDPDVIASAEKLVLPGVGSFAAAMSWLVSTNIDAAIRTAVDGSAFLLGICVGHQLLFERSFEMGETPGLGLIAGDVDRFEGTLPVPQIGWNRVSARGALFEGVESDSFYFVNSYAARNAADEIARADYNGAFTAAVRRERVFGVQFHPEKSSSAGLRVLRNFVQCN